MKYYQVLIEFDDAVKAKNESEAWNKTINDVLPRMQDLSENIKITECDKKTYQYHTRE